MSAHTPGPWIVVHEPKEPAPWAVTAAGYYIASLHRGTPADAEAANARLIGASPDLLAALRQLRIDANRLCDRQLGGSYESDCRHAIDAADAAIAKAEGHLDTHPSSERQRAR